MRGVVKTVPADRLLTVAVIENGGDKPMATKAKAKSASKRTKVKSLPKSTKQLSGKSMKKIKGGLITVRKAGEKPVEY